MEKDYRINISIELYDGDLRETRNCFNYGTAQCIQEILEKELARVSTDLRNDTLVDELKKQIGKMKELLLKSRAKSNYPNEQWKQEFRQLAE